MTNSTREIWDILSNDVSIRKDIARGIINNRALAKYLIKQHHLKISLDGAISSIRRFEKDQQVQDDFTTVKEALKGAKISTRTNIACITISQNSENAKYLAQFITDPFFMHNESVRLTKGEETMKIIFSQVDLDKVKKIIPPNMIESVVTDLAELNIFLTKKAYDTKGVYARIGNEIANYGININEIITVVPELIVFIKNKDLIKAHEAVFALIARPEDV